MSAKKAGINHVSMYDPPPETLIDHPFYGLILDPEQKKFRNAIWSSEYDIVFCNAKAGTGKSLVAVATGMLLCRCGLYDGLVYITSPVQEAKLGFLPGTAEDKIAPYSAPIYNALLKIGEIPERCIVGTNIDTMKSGEAIVQCMSHVYLRGLNFERKVVIIDESQNMYIDELLKTLTRMHDNCKVIVIGHSGQCDLLHNPERSGFEPYMRLFAGMPRCAVCELHTNHRGWISTTADTIYEHM